MSAVKFSAAYFQRKAPHIQVTNPQLSKLFVKPLTAWDILTKRTGAWRKLSSRDRSGFLTTKGVLADKARRVWIAYALDRTLRALEDREALGSRDGSAISDARAWAVVTAMVDNKPLTTCRDGIVQLRQHAFSQAELSVSREAPFAARFWYTKAEVFAAIYDLFHPDPVIAPWGESVDGRVLTVAALTAARVAVAPWMGSVNLYRCGHAPEELDFYDRDEYATSDVSLESQAYRDERRKQLADLRELLQREE